MQWAAICKWFLCHYQLEMGGKVSRVDGGDGCMAILANINVDYTVGNWFLQCQPEIAGKFCQRRWWWQLASDFCQCQLAMAGERWGWRWVPTASKAAPPVAMAASPCEHQSSQYVFLNSLCDLGTLEILWLGGKLCKKLKRKFAMAASVRQYQKFPSCVLLLVTQCFRILGEPLH